MAEPYNYTGSDNDELRAGINRDMAAVQDAGGSWAEALQSQQRERASRSGMDTYGQMKELVGRQELAELQNGQRAQDAVASAFAIARERKDGRLPQVVTDYLNRQFGFDGKTAGIVEGGIDPKTGEFGFVFGERDNAGNTSYRKQTIPLAVQLGLMEGYPGLFGDEAVAAHRKRMLDSGQFSSGEVEAYSKAARLARDRLAKRMDELSPRDTKLEVERMRQEGLNRRADLRDQQFGVSAKNAQEKNALMREKMDAEIAQAAEAIKQKYAQMGVQYGLGETRKNAQTFVNKKLSEQPTEQPKPTQGGGDKATPKPGDNGGHEFKQLSRDEYSALSPEEKQKYREAWMQWKSNSQK